MATTPIYEELEQKVKEIEKEGLERKERESRHCRKVKRSGALWQRLPHV